MHIAFYVPGWPPEKYSNGIVTYSNYMIKGLEKRGHKVSIITPELGTKVEDPNVFVVKRGFWDMLKTYIPRYHESVYQYSKYISEEFLKLHKRDPIDVIEMEESFGWFAEVAARTKLPLVTKLHGPAFLTLNGFETDIKWVNVKMEQEGKALLKAQAIISPSQYTLDRITDKYQLQNIPSAVIVNPIANNASTPLWKLEQCDPNHILFIGRFDLLKGGDVMLKAFKIVLQSKPNSKLIFVGQDLGIKNSINELIHFNSFCEDLFSSDFRENIEFKGVLKPAELNLLRTKAMVTVIASRFESYGYTTLEAMFQGCPVVNTDAGGCREMIDDRRTGLLANSGDPEDFAEKIAYMLDHPKEAEAMGRAAREKVLLNNAPDKIVEETLKMYEIAIENHAKNVTALR